MLLIPEQVKFLREEIASLKRELEGYDNYLENRGVTNIESSTRIQTSDFMSDSQFVAKQNKLREYQNLLLKSEYVKEVPTEEIGIGTKFTVQFDGEEAEEFILADSIIGSNLSNQTITMESPLGKNIIGKKEGDSFSYTTTSGYVITGKIQEIKKQNKEYTTYIKSIPFSDRRSIRDKTYLTTLKEEMKTTEARKIEYEKREELSKSQLELLYDEIERLSKMVPKDKEMKTRMNKRIQAIKKIIATRKVAQLPTDGSIGIGSAFSIIFFGTQKTICKRVEMINYAVGDEIADHYVERIDPLGSKLFGLKENDEFIIRLGNNHTVTGIVYDIDNQLERVETTSPLEYQKAKRR